jgi:GR25 family glycosyltransferase involved in LPS biosynthesis
MEDKYSAYVISLEQPTTLLNTIKKMGIKTNLIKGVNGKTLDNDQIKKNTTLFGSLFSPRSVIGIAMAHIKAWETFLESGEKYGMIFEDDVVFEDNFKERMDKVLKNTPENFDLLYLGCVSCDNINIVTMVQGYAGRLNMNAKKVNKYVNIPVLALALHGYIVSISGAKKLIKYIKGYISDHLDIQIQELTSKNLINTYAANELIAYQTSTDETQSSNISNTHPLLINNLLSNYYLEKKVKINYGSTVSLMRINNVNLNFIL